MRKGEILSLKWDNLDLRHRFILLDHAKNGERREIPINETLKDVLKGITRRLDVPYVSMTAIRESPLRISKGRLIQHADVQRSWTFASMI